MILASALYKAVGRPPGQVRSSQKSGEYVKDMHKRLFLHYYHPRTQYTAVQSHGVDQPYRSLSQFRVEPSGYNSHWCMS